MSSKTRTIEEVAQDLQDLANSYDESNLRDLALKMTTPHRSLQQAFMRGFVLPLVKEWAARKEGGNFDLRNEDTVVLASKWVNAMESKDHGLRHI